MTSEAEIRIRSRISTSELERRWKEVRQSMEDRKLDFLIIQNGTDILGGYLKWFTDVSTRNDYPATVIFARGEEMTTIWHGPWPPAEPQPPSWSLRGVKKRISVPRIPTLAYSCSFDAEKVVEELSRYGKCRVGLVGMGFISAAFYKYLTNNLTAAEFEDATDIVDNIKTIKSDEEIRLIKETCAIQDAVFEYALTRIKPGRREYEVHADVMHKCLELGSEQANIMLGSVPAGAVSKRFKVNFGNKVIDEGDHVTLLIESNGPSGFYAELGRTVCFGKIPSGMEENEELAKEAVKKTLNRLRPGTKPATIFEAHNQFMRSIGAHEETRIFAHGMGYDMVESPSITSEETMRIQARMDIVIHPTLLRGKSSGWACENYIVSESGEHELLHKTDRKIFVI
jgi:Xaa-Pro aminopeptidase